MCCCCFYDVEIGSDACSCSTEYKCSKVAWKVILSGKSTKERCLAAQIQNDMSVPHEDLLKILVWFIMDNKIDIFVHLEHDPNI